MSPFKPFVVFWSFCKTLAVVFVSDFKKKVFYCHQIAHQTTSTHWLAKDFGWAFGDFLETAANPLHSMQAVLTKCAVLLFFQNPMWISLLYPLHPSADELALQVCPGICRFNISSPHTHTKCWQAFDWFLLVYLTHIHRLVEWAVVTCRLWLDLCWAKTKQKTKGHKM